MSRLTIPATKIELYVDGFADHDWLGRENTGAALSDLVERIEEPMVIALDGGWGTGKSHFLKCWTGEHLKRQDRTTETVYFDAFASDFMDAPLVSLLACMSNRFENTLGPTARGNLDGVKEVARKLVPSVIRIGAAVATYGATTLVGDLGDTIAKGLGDEAKSSADSFWADAQKRQTIMEEFQDALAKLTQTEDGKTRKLIIIVDELDRCRPDYALALLEIIKHFFAVDNVHFVLGVNMRELENSVKARYGAGINAGLYLQKFVTLTVGLPERDRHDSGRDIALTYFKIVAGKVGFEGLEYNFVSTLIQIFTKRDAVSLRGVERLLSLAQVTSFPPDMVFGGGDYDGLFVATLVILKAWAPESYQTIKDGKGTVAELEDLFDLQTDQVFNTERLPEMIRKSWLYFLDPEAFVKSTGQTDFKIPSRATRYRDLTRLIDRRLEVFQLPR